jgi:hypothetical protein
MDRLAKAGRFMDLGLLLIEQLCKLEEVAHRPVRLVAVGLKRLLGSVDPSHFEAGRLPPWTSSWTRQTWITSSGRKPNLATDFR